MKHTSGYWTVVGYEIHDINGAVIAIAPIGGDVEKRGEIEGNLALIAAAPRLLTTSKLLLDYLRQFGRDPSAIIKELEDAITSATKSSSSETTGPVAEVDE